MKITLKEFPLMKGVVIFYKLASCDIKYYLQQAVKLKLDELDSTNVREEHFLKT